MKTRIKLVDGTFYVTEKRKLMNEWWFFAWNELADGRLHGSSKCWYPSSDQLMFERQYHFGKRRGRSVVYHPNGKIASDELC